MNFRLGNSKRYKVICKKSCPFYLWVATMVKDRNTIQIKSGIFKNECARDYKIRHVNTQWIAHNYLEQFIVDFSWSIVGIIQVVKTNKEMDISGLKTWMVWGIGRR